MEVPALGSTGDVRFVRCVAWWEGFDCSSVTRQAPRWRWEEDARVAASGNSWDEDLVYLFRYAREDWVGLSSVTAVAGTVAGEGATFDELVSAMLAVLGDLIDRGAVPGDLVAQGTGFEPWRGTKEERRTTSPDRRRDRGTRTATGNRRSRVDPLPVRQHGRLPVNRRVARIPSIDRR
jgi:hypothetical protein